MNKIIMHFRNPFILMAFLFANPIFADSTDIKLPVQAIPILTKNQAWLIEDPSTPLVFVEITFEKTGSFYMPPNKDGLSTLYANLFFVPRKGENKNIKQTEMNHLKLNGQSFISHDNLSFSLSFPKENSEKVIPLIQSLFQNSVFSEEEVNNHKYSGQTNLMAGSPSLAAEQSLLMKAYEGHPYGKSAQGDSNHIQILRAEDVRKFPEEFLAKENLKISFLGNLKPKEVQEFSHKFFGFLPDTKTYPIQDVPYVEPKKIPETIHLYQDIPQSNIAFLYPAPPFDTKDYYYALIANTLLGLTQQSKLWRAIRVKRGMVYDIGSDIINLPKTTYLFGTASTQGLQSHAILEIVMQKFMNLKTKGIKEKDLLFAQSHLIGKTVTNLIEPIQIIQLMHKAQIANQQIDFLEKFISSVKSVDLDGLNKFLQTWIDPSKINFSIVGKEIPALPPKKPESELPESAK